MRIGFSKWILQILVPLFCLTAHTFTQAEPFASEHEVVRYIALVVIYLVLHGYIYEVRRGNL